MVEIDQLLPQTYLRPYKGLSSSPPTPKKYYFKTVSHETASESKINRRSKNFHFGITAFSKRQRRDGKRVGRWRERRQGGKGKMKGRKRETEKEFVCSYELTWRHIYKLLRKNPQPKQHIQGLSTLIKLARGTAVPAWKSVNYVGTPGGRKSMRSVQLGFGNILGFGLPGICSTLILSEAHRCGPRRACII